MCRNSAATPIVCLDDTGLLSQSLGEFMSVDMRAAALVRCSCLAKRLTGVRKHARRVSRPRRGGHGQRRDLNFLRRGLIREVGTGKTFARLMIDAYPRREITAADLTDYLGVRFHHCPQLSACWKRLTS